jgi:hypothetical protein
LDKLSYEKQDKLRQEQVQQNLEKAEQKAEIKKSMQIAKQMKLANEPIDKIIRFTGLTKDQIDKL